VLSTSIIQCKTLYERFQELTQVMTLYERFQELTQVMTLYERFQELTQVYAISLSLSLDCNSGTTYLSPYVILNLPYWNSACC